MLKDVEVKKIVAGVSSPEEIFEINLWMQEQYARDQAILPTRVVSTEYGCGRNPCYSLQLDEDDWRATDANIE